MNDDPDVRLLRRARLPVDVLLVEDGGKAIVSLAPSEAIEFAATVLRAAIGSATDPVERAQLANETATAVLGIINDVLARAEATLQ